MRNVVAILAVLVSMVCSGCGNNPAAVTTVYDPLPTPVGRPASFPAVMWGANQPGVALSLATPVTVSTFAGSIAGFSNNTTARSMTFNRPLAVTTDGVNLYVADYLNNVIRQINLVTRRASVLAGSSAGLAGSADGVGFTASFNRPNGVTTDKTFLYVTDSGNYTIRKIDIATGTVTTLAGSPGQAASVDSVGLTARFNILNGITTDGASLYVTDSNNTIRRILISGTGAGTVTTLAGAPGTSGSVDGAQRDARFNQLSSLTTDGANLYVTDSGNSTIRRIDLATGSVTTIAGAVSPGGAAGTHRDSTDGTGFTARFNQPAGITTDGVNLYVVDLYDNAIRKIVIAPSIPGSVYSGNVTTLATIGSPALNSSIGITTDGTGLYVSDISADTSSHAIKYLQ